MLLKLLGLLLAAIPVILLLRSIFFRRGTKLGEALHEFKRQIDIAIYIFLGIIGCVVAFALVRLAWAWWMGS